MRTRRHLLVMLAALPIVGCSLFGSHPSDAAMIRHFKRHRTEFERLVSMSNTDKAIIRVMPDQTLPAPDGVSAQRQDEYRILFRAIGSEHGICRYESDLPGVVYILYSDIGLVTHGTSKGYTYSKTALAPEYPSLDATPSDLARDVKGYRRIDQNWYIYLEWD